MWLNGCDVSYVAILIQETTDLLGNMSSDHPDQKDPHWSRMPSPRRRGLTIMKMHILLPW